MKALSIITTIGDKNLSNKAIDSFEMDRNFSDVSNKFTMTIVDSPEVALVDLELYMNAGYRSIKVSYTDTGNVSTYSQFSGTIWDYTCTFVGDIKKLQVTGYLSRSINGDYSGQACYNIDWNSYYNLRHDETKLWNVCEQVRESLELKSEYEFYNNKSDDQLTLSSDVVSNDFLKYYNYNSKFMEIKGPSKKSVYIPIPDLFTEMQITPVDKNGNVEKDEDTGDTTLYDDYDRKDKFWGVLTPKKLDASIYTDPDGNVILTENTTTVWYDKFGKIRAFRTADDQPAYIQMNSNKSYYGGGQMLYNQTGVNISYIIYQLCQLEGWEIGNIVKTELVPCSDKLKMQNQTALQFINEVLIPMSVTPVGNYKDTSGNTITLSQGQTGFVAYFKDNKFYYEPLNNQSTRNLTSDETYVFGYNIKNSPVMSFQVETKGTTFYTAPVQINALSITTGKETTEMIVASESLIKEYNKVKGHNESLDNYFGYTYEEVKNIYSDALENYNYIWSVFVSEAQSWSSVIADSTPNGKSTDLYKWFGSKYQAVGISSYTAYSNSVVQEGLVTLYPTSADNDATTKTKLESAYSRIKNYTIKANMTIWGNPKLSPNSIITILNMVKKNNRYLPEEHPTSGKYRILNQKDSISQGKFIQQLTLIRNDKIDANINTKKIDWSKPVEKIKVTNIDGKLVENINSSNTKTYC